MMAIFWTLCTIPTPLRCAARWHDCKIWGQRFFMAGTIRPLAKTGCANLSKPMAVVRIRWSTWSTGTTRSGAKRQTFTPITIGQAVSNHDALSPIGRQSPQT